MGRWGAVGRRDRSGRDRTASVVRYEAANHLRVLLERERVQAYAHLAAENQFEYDDSIIERRTLTGKYDGLASCVAVLSPVPGVWY